MYWLKCFNNENILMSRNFDFCFNLVTFVYDYQKFSIKVPNFTTGQERGRLRRELALLTF